jgi:bifunctional lysine-specific demethylase and histidyl-hydroxylase NO66
VQQLRPALARLVGDADGFLAEGWARRAHLRRATDVGGLLSLDDADHLLTATALRAPSFRLVKHGATVPASECTRRARIGSRTVTDLIDPARVGAHLADGATVVLQGVHRYWPPVTDLCRALEAELTHPVQANAYLTPPVAQGLRVHADAHDVFAVQTHGTKQWVVYEGAQEPGSDGSGGSPTLDTSLEVGDVLYLPTGVHHAARTTDAPSLHLTLGVRRLTWADVVRRALDAAGADDALNEPLPVGFADDPEALVEEAGRRIARAADRLLATEPLDVVTGIARQLWRGRPPALRGHIRQLVGLDAIDDGTPVRPRAVPGTQLLVDDGRVSVVLGDRTVRLPDRVEGAVRAFLSGSVTRVADLAGELDGSGRVTLVRRLVREGLLEVVDG